MPQIPEGYLQIADASAAEGYAVIDVRKYDDITAQLSAVGFNGVVQFFGSLGAASSVDTAPDPSAAASDTNRYWPVGVDDQDSQTLYQSTGTSGVPFSTETKVQGVHVNVGRINWLVVKWSRSAGSISIAAAGIKSVPTSRA